jgi:hypothetical protein
VSSPVATAPTAAKPKLPNGLRWSDVWRNKQGGLVQGDREVPVDKEWRITGRMFLCPAEGCQIVEWAFGPDADGDPQRCCTRHPMVLIEMPIDPADRNPVRSGRERLAARVREIVAARRQKAAKVLAAQAEAARVAAAEAAKRRARDLRGHVPSLAITGGVLVGGLAAAETGPAAAALASGLLASGGVVASYVAAYVVQKARAQEALKGRSGRNARARARRIAAAAFAAGMWLLAAVPLTMLSPVWGAAAAALLGVAGSWAVNRDHWESLWETRRRLAELARQKADAAAQRAEEEQRKATEPAPPASAAVQETPEEMGRRMASLWVEISRSSTVPSGFPMSKTWIVPGETREVSAPIDGATVRLGWEYAIESEPGALVARIGQAPPLVAAREWLAAMLGVNSSHLSLVDRPEGRANRGLMLLTDRAPLGGVVKWKGRSGVRFGSDGTIYVHAGRSILGEDVEDAAFVPGQPGGGLTVGHTGGGKTATMILTFLNDLAAGIFDILYDPKQLVDYGDFVGVFPIGVTREHRDVILRSVVAERRRRERSLAARRDRDRHNRLRPQHALWDVRRDGPPVRHAWEEFHMEAADKPFVDALTEQKRLERTAAMMTELVTQGGGLADLNNSVLRGLTGLTRLRLFRMPDQQARLAGYTGVYMPSELPRLPGMCLTASAEAPPVPLRTAFVTREDEDGCVFDQLYAPDMSPLLAAPPLPEDTLAVFEREGLMDLWRLGQGPDGMSRLLADADALYPGSAAMAGAQVPSASGGPVQAADVLLAVVTMSPGCGSLTISDHAVWRTGSGGGKAPVPSTLSRAANSLEKDGLITRHKVGAEYRDYRVTAKGQTRAQAAAVALGLLAAPQGGPTPAELERQAEAASEQLELGVG